MVETGHRLLGFHLYYSYFYIACRDRLANTNGQFWPPADVSAGTAAGQYPKLREQMQEQPAG
jgi:hypothetical protein